MTDYEKARQARIKQNRSRMKDLGVTSMAYQLKQSMKGSKQTKKSKKVTKDTDEYTPDEEGELNHSSEEDENQIRKNSLNLRSRSKKVVALRGKNPTNIKDTTSVSSVPMANLVKMRHQNNEKQQVGQGLQGRDSTQRKIQLGKSTAQKNLSSYSQQEKGVEIGNGVQAKIAQSKAMVAPGSLSAFRQMKTQLIEKEKRGKQTYLLQRQLQPVNRASSQVLLGGSQAHSFSQPQRIEPDLHEDYENHMGSNECNLEQYADEEDE
ncbi:uncharacterized protein LOC110708979 [Chenopodium quinoa]|uniref:uncharacterized protein LOC110708979 n=1 Tax=Chenopodium quinoa TaxID=63459 RepID=UPI000B799A5C|nr:uncharacterized protein LOC110708979 [Chenopodium quinoa]